MFAVLRGWRGGDLEYGPRAAVGATGWLAVPRAAFGGRSYGLLLNRLPKPSDWTRRRRDLFAATAWTCLPLEVEGFGFVEAGP
jgi:hypothetical protein